MHISCKHDLMLGNVKIGYNWN